MLAQSNPPAAHAGEDRSSPGAAVVEQAWSAIRPEHVAASLAELAQKRQWLRPGDVVYRIQIGRHVLTEGDLNAAARAVIGGAA